MNGYWYRNDSVKTITVPASVIGTTGHRVILRYTAASDTIEAVLLSSSDGVSLLPALTQNSDTYEVPLATLTKTVGGTVSLTDVRVFAEYATNHVKRNGDTMTGVLNLATANPVIRFRETDGTTDNRYWDVGANGEQFLLRALNDALSSASNVLVVDRTGTTIDTVNFPNGTLQSAGNEVWDRGDFSIRRQGGNASNWSTAGTTNYTPSSVRIQIGVVERDYNGGSTAVTFPTPFSGAPVVTVTPVSVTYYEFVSITGVNANGFTINLDATTSSATAFTWMAIGPA